MPSRLPLTGAATYASETYQKAVQGLENAEGYLKGKAGSKPIGTVAREAVQMAEDARIITVKKIAEEQLASERQAGTEREALAESKRAAAQDDAARVTRDAETARVAAQSEADRLKRENATKMLAAQDETERANRVNAAQWPLRDPRPISSSSSMTHSWLPRRPRSSV